MEKTALQLYVDEIKRIQSEVPEMSRLLYQAFIDKAIEFIEAERLQIEKSFMDGAIEASKSCLDKSRYNESPEEYYNRLYK